MSKLKHLSVSEAEANAFCSMLDGYLPPEIVQHQGRRAAVDKMLASLDELASQEVATKRAEYFGVADHKLLLERVLFREGNRIVIAGLRFKKLNPKFPFVQLCANFHFTKQDLLALKEQVAFAFPPLLLKGITLRHPPSFFADEVHQKWSHLVFGETARIPCPPLPTEFRVQWGGALDFYPQYENEFQGFLAENPHKETYLSIEDEEDLKNASDDRLLMSLWDEKRLGWCDRGKVKRSVWPSLRLYLRDFFGKEAARTRVRSFVASTFPIWNQRAAFVCVWPYQ